ncbi:hypothetical protein [Kribbella sp. NPDC051137]|uniref:hypothetical protein n=1 Tax=Kribbella sp. NPDC051137 TaxID=3155045 RepID=UPI00342B98CF
MSTWAPARRKFLAIVCRLSSASVVWNGSSAGAGHDRRSQSTSMTAPGIPRRSSSSPSRSAVVVFPVPTLPLIKTVSNVGSGID